jgi:uncharacterized membrane protein YcgQ (UPF0703/DUF1980 family)
MAQKKASPFVPIAVLCGIGTLLVIGITFLKNSASVASRFNAATAQPNAAAAQPKPTASQSNAAAAQLNADTAQSGADNVIEIREKLFIAQTNDIYLNSEDYLGKTIRLEGLFKTEQYEGDDPYCFVIRYGPGCCGYDGTAGFEVAWTPRTTDDPDANVLVPRYPQEDDWVEAVGTLSSYEEDGYPYIYLQLASLTVKEDRGAEFVSQ